MTKEKLCEKISALADEAKKNNEETISMLLHAVSGASVVNCDDLLLIWVFPFTEKLKSDLQNEMIKRLN